MKPSLILVVPLLAYSQISAIGQAIAAGSHLPAGSNLQQTPKAVSPGPAHDYGKLSLSFEANPGSNRRSG